MDLTAHQGDHLRLFADCVPVRGVRRSAIYDLTRGELHLFPTEYFAVLEWLTSRPVAALLDELASTAPEPRSHSTKLEEFVQFLLDNELVMFTSDPLRFPQIDTTWDYPGEVQSAIIDVDARVHDFRLILSQLDALGCQFLQLRGFSSLLTLDLCREILAFAKDTSITSVELILRYDPGVPADQITGFMRAEPLVTSLTLHSAPERTQLVASMAELASDTPALERMVTLTPQVIDTASHCGLITQEYLSPPTVATYAELRHFNGCLNRKISVDDEGNIRNCPSMGRSFGQAVSTRLAEVIEKKEFRAAWTVSKDSIDVCSGCEFRYVCTDCRAYLEQPSNPHSKPLKCGYNPSTSTWDDWYRPTFKATVCDHYGLKPPTGTSS